MKTNAVFLKLKNRQRRLLTLKERNRGLNRILLITNLIILLFLMFLIHASALTTLSSRFDRSPGLTVSTSRISAQISVQESNLLRLRIGRTLEKQLPQSHFFRKIR